MIDVKNAVSSAYKYLQAIQEMFGGEFDDLRLEEIELSEDQTSWLITLGYDLPIKNRSALHELLATPTQPQQLFRREYKLFKVNAETGMVEAMKIRKV
ncbi:MAG: hypothetical protein B0A82_16650 [Alkalinema sp. CACIAM 70d]|nr:MAG: hypothetical protein B0A82_16650 [Alkalinema sp. CACIAM 70d]